MDFKTIDANTLVEGLKQCSDECRAKAKEFLNTPTADEKAKQEAEAKAAEEQKAKDEAAAKEKAETEKKEAVDAAVAECQKKADDAAKEAEKKATEEKDKACDAAVNEFRKAVALANDAKPKFGEVSLEGIKTERDLAVKLCTCDAAPSFLKSVKPEESVVALRSFIAGSGATGVVNKVVDSAAKAAADDFWATH